MNMGEALRQEGRQEGMQKGMHTVAVNMLNEGADTQFVQRVTGLSPEQIDQLSKKHTKPSAH